MMTKESKQMNEYKIQYKIKIITRGRKEKKGKRQAAKKRMKKRDVEGRERQTNCKE